MYTPNSKDEFAKLYFLLTKMEEYGNTSRRTDSRASLNGLDYLYIKSRYLRQTNHIGEIKS